MEPRQAERGRANGVDVAVCDVTSGLPFADNTFDCVYAGEIIEHLVDTDFFVSEIARVTRPNGAAVITTPNLASLQNRGRLALGKYPAWVEYRLEGGQGHVRSYTIGTLSDQLATHGFTIERVRGDFIQFVPARLYGYPDISWLSFLADWFPMFARCMIVKARKSPH
jgi:SAM-dependent methyltransferase